MTNRDFSTPDVGIALLPAPALSMIWRTGVIPFSFVMPDLPEDRWEEFARELAAVYTRVVCHSEKENVCDS